MNINHTRLQQHFEAMSLIGKIGETGTNRPAHSPDEKKAFELAASWMKDAGMKTHIDNFGNLVGRLEGKNAALPVLMMGSHLDSQPYGGRFDGVAGVLCAIEAVKAITENNLSTNVSRGENAGRRLNHRTVTRSLNVIGQFPSAEAAITIDKSWKRENVRIVAFLQERNNRRILGAAMIAL